MPSYTTKSTTTLLPPFPPAVTEAAIKSSSTACDPSFVTSNLLSLSSYLVDFVNHTTIFGPAVNDAYQPSLKTLYDRLVAGHASLTPLPALAKDAARLKVSLNTRVEMDISSRPLEDLEDLYYAVLARMQEMLHTLNMRITSGFNTASDALCPGGPSITAWHTSLTEYWAILNEPACGRALDDAVRAGRIDALYGEIQARRARNEISHETADMFLEELYGAKESTEGMMWVAEWNPVVVGVRLEEKYRTLFKVVREEDERRRRERDRRRRSKVPGKDVRVKKRRSVEGRKRCGIEEMLEEMQEGLLRLQDGGPVEHPDDRDTRQLDTTTRIEDGQANSLDTTQQDHRTPPTEWSAKSQRVYDYAAYLRGQASHDARSIVTGSTYNPLLDGSTLRNPYEEFVAGKYTDLMG
jgi:hypothetical protein